MWIVKDTFFCFIGSLWTITREICQEWFHHHSICFSSNIWQVARRACNGNRLLNVDSNRICNLSFIMSIATIIQGCKISFKDDNHKKYVSYLKRDIYKRTRRGKTAHLWTVKPEKKPLWDPKTAQLFQTLKEIFQSV